MTMLRSIRRGAGLLASAVLLSGCAASGAAGTPGAGAATGAAPSPAPGATGAAVVSGGPGSLAPGASPQSACTLLSDAEIQAITGITVASKAPKFMSGLSPNG